MLPRKKCTLSVAMAMLLICAILVLHVLFNFFSIFWMKRRTNTYSFCKYEGVSDSKNSNKRHGYSFIPRNIHQLFFNATDDSIPVDLEFARQSWVIRNRSFKYTLWNASMVIDLISSQYSELLPLYKSYSHWVRRADVARYVILYEHGGLYVDLDIGSKGHTEVLLNSLEKETDIALYLTKPVGVSNDFMLAKPRHPFFNHVICGLEAGNRWYILPFLTTIMQTGPGYLYSRYKTYDRPNDIQILREKQLKPYIKHQDGGAWHGVDAKITWWIFMHWNYYVQNALVILAGATLFGLIVLRYRLRIVYLIKSL